MLKPLAILLLLTGCVADQTQGGQTRERVVGGGEDMQIVFTGMPSDVPHVARIAPTNEPGTRMRLGGVVKDPSGKPVSGVVVYAYHTDSGGIYPRAETRHGRLRGWSKTNEKGEYVFDTIRPGGYPGAEAAEHVHMHVIEPGRCTYWIDDVHFTDDPRLTQAERDRRNPRGGRGVVTPRIVDGVWIANRDITLGLNVPGWPAR